MEISSDQVKQLREKTGVSVMLIRRALLEAEGDESRALEILAKMGAEIVEKKGSRTIGAGIIDAYVHHNKQVGVLLKARSETDFVANSPEYQSAMHGIAMHIAATGSSSVESLLTEPFIQDPSKNVAQVLADLTSKFGERIIIEEFVRMNI